MHKILAISILSMISIPAAANAEWIDEMVEAAKNGNGVVVESHSSASSGGQTAAHGESVTTGDVSASSHTETHINAGSRGGTVEVKVETSKNGVTETKEYVQQVEPDAGVKVEVEASATDEGTESEVLVDGKVVAEGNVEQIASASSSIEGDFSEFVTETVPHFFGKVLDFLWPF